MIKILYFCKNSFKILKKIPKDVNIIVVQFSKL